MKYFIKTFGCQMNIADSQRIAAGLEARGYSRAVKMSDADLTIINTCSVRQSAEDKVYGLANKINELRATHSSLRTILTGCMVGSAMGERRRLKLTELQRRMPWVDGFIRSEDLVTPARWIPPRRWKSAKEPALIPVMRGCDQFCSYCVVPYGRGPVRSRPMEETIKEIECLVKQGVKWVMLLGQSINDYRHKIPNSKIQISNSFVCLLKKVHEIEGLEKISLLSFNPWNFPDELIEVLALPKFERYIHLPVQSGDDAVLKKMNRPYTITEYKTLVKKIRQKIPGVRIGTDAIVGFPGETEKQFQNTVKLFEELKFDQAFIAMYSERPGTAAAKLYQDGVPLKEKKRRHKILMQIEKSKKTLGIDWGEKRIGLALATNGLAEPLSTIEVASYTLAVKKIAEICQREKIQRIVLGLPLKSERVVKEFGRKLATATGLKIIFWDEVLTSEEALAKMIEAGRPQKKRRHLDDVVAALILQEYLDSQQ